MANQYLWKMELSQGYGASFFMSPYIVELKILMERPFALVRLEGTEKRLTMNLETETLTDGVT
jgi:hypothetical protein